MAKYRRKPGVVEAVQWTGVRFSDLPAPAWLATGFSLPRRERGALHRDEDDIMAHTPDGWRRCRPKDWLIKRGNGDLHVLPADVFEQVYEKD